MASDSSTSADVATQLDSEYDFIKDPPSDYFCPVTFELLTEPHQTLCCGKQLSQQVVKKLQSDGKPCPFCKQTELKTILDRYMQGKVKEIKVRCCNKLNGCDWEGEIGNLKTHAESCQKRPWSCNYCDFATTFDIGTTKHISECVKYPIKCPNCCAIDKVPRCDLENHLMHCPLQLVPCGFRKFGCEVKIARKDLANHMDDTQHHILCATLLNLQLTQETISAIKKQEDYEQICTKLKGEVEDNHAIMVIKDQQLAELKTRVSNCNAMMAEKDQQLAELKTRVSDCDAMMAEKDQQLAELKTRVSDCDAMMAEKDRQLAELNMRVNDCDAMMAEKDRQLAELKRRVNDCDAMMAEKDRQLAELKKQVVDYDSIIATRAKATASRMSGSETQQQKIQKERDGEQQTGVGATPMLEQILHHDVNPGDRQPSYMLLTEYEKLFTNVARSVLDQLKCKNWEPLVCRRMLTTVFKDAFLECKSSVCEFLFQDLFQPHGQGHDLKDAHEEAKIYQYLFNKSTVTPLEMDLMELKVRHRAVFHSSCEYPPELTPFIKGAINIAWKMVTAQPPMIISFPPTYDGDLHVQRFRWDEKAHNDGCDLIYYRPVLYANYETILPDKKGWVGTK